MNTWCVSSAVTSMICTLTMFAQANYLPPGQLSLAAHQSLRVHASGDLKHSRLPGHGKGVFEGYTEFVL